MAMWVPPAAIRAFVITPVTYVGSLVVTVLSPVLHLVLAAIDLVDRKRWRFTRLGGLGIAFCVVEFIGLTIAFVLWVASGFGLWMRSDPLQRAHRWLLGVWLELITRAIRFFIGFEFEFPAQDPAPGPLLVLCRHAGPGDALLVARSMMRDHGRKLRMLGTTKLLWDPFFNHAIRRLPFHFCEPNPRHVEQELEAVRRAAATIEPDGAMIIFPEGGNYTKRRYEAAIEYFEQRGLADRLARTRAMLHVLPPRPGGTLSALEASNATTYLLAHVGLDDLQSLGDLWRAVPIRRTVRASYIRMEGSASAAPTDEAQIEWLFDQWQKVDDWIEAHAATVLGDDGVA